MDEREEKLVEAAGDGDAGLAEDVCDLGFAEAGGVVFEREVALGVVELEAAEAVGVGEFAEGAELVVRERRLQFEFGFQKRHGESIAESVDGFECGRHQPKKQKQIPLARTVRRSGGPRAKSALGMTALKKRAKERSIDKV